METRQLIVWGFAVACLSLSHARFLKVVVPTYWDVGAKPALMEDMAEGAAGPERDHSREPVQNQGRPQNNQIHPAVEGFPQKFPEGRLVVQKKPVRVFQQTVKTERLGVRCGGKKVQVEVKQDLMGKGKLIKPEELTLGGCSPTEVDSWAHVLVFESELHGCGSTLQVRKLRLLPVFFFSSEVRNQTCCFCL